MVPSLSLGFCQFDFREAKKEVDVKKDYSIKITDKELFDACEGRTARKGARGEQKGKIERAKKADSLDIESCIRESSEFVAGQDIADCKKKRKSKRDNDTVETKKHKKHKKKME